MFMHALPYLLVTRDVFSSHSFANCHPHLHSLRSRRYMRQFPLFFSPLSPELGLVLSSRVYQIFLSFFISPVSLCRFHGHSNIASHSQFPTLTTLVVRLICSARAEGQRELMNLLLDFWNSRLLTRDSIG